jgi:hypothetical protein
MLLRASFFLYDIFLAAKNILWMSRVCRWIAELDFRCTHLALLKRRHLSNRLAYSRVASPIVPKRQPSPRKCRDEERRDNSIDDDLITHFSMASESPRDSGSLHSRFIVTFLRRIKELVSTQPVEEGSPKRVSWGYLNAKSLISSVEVRTR